MHWIVFLCLNFMNYMPLYETRPDHEENIQRTINEKNFMPLHKMKHDEEMNIKRTIEIMRRFLGRHNKLYPILGAPKSIEDLPRAEPILPGHTLLKPTFGMLKSAVKFPHKDLNTAGVYGNLDNLGITYGNKGERILYTDFRKANNLLEPILGIIQDRNKENRIKIRPLVIIETSSNDLNNLELPIQYLEDQKETTEEENNANEILDQSLESADVDLTARRSKSGYRERKRKYTSEDSSEESDSSGDYEKNPGNPFTVHKNRYKQNWMWNHFMDGDHMNVNPYGPKLNSLAPSGADIMFARKWWYFNQDDYLPFR